MRVITRTAAAALSALALLTVVAGTALAGGWAEVTVAPHSGDAPVAGEERELRLTVLQHGIAPVDWGDVTLTGTNAATGETITVAARSAGDGEWIAPVTFPTDGTWQLAVAHSDLETSALPSLSVGQAESLTWLPAVLVVAALGAMAAVGLAGMALAPSRRRTTHRTVSGAAVRAEG